MRTAMVGMMLALWVTLAFVRVARCHDGWIQSSVPRVAVGDMCYMDMLFGNHGNTYRDYKVWGSKWDVTSSTFALYTPEGQVVDLKDAVMDVGRDEMKTVGGVSYKDVNGYLVASFQAQQKGICIDVRQDKVVSYREAQGVLAANLSMLGRAKTTPEPGSSPCHGRGLAGSTQLPAAAARPPILPVWRSL